MSHILSAGSSENVGDKRDKFYIQTTYGYRNSPDFIAAFLIKMFKQSPLVTEEKIFLL